MSEDTYFLSYSTVDAAEFAPRLAADLAQGWPPYGVWIDRRDMRPARAWDDQVTEAIRNCEAMLFVITADSVSPASICLKELRKAVSYKRPIIPLRLNNGVEAPLLLANVQDVRFGRDYEAGLAKLRKHLDWMRTGEGQLQVLQDQLVQARHTLRRVPEDSRAAVASDIADLRRRIRALRTLINDPQKVSSETHQRIESGLNRARQPRRARHPGLIEPSGIRFVNSAPLAAPEYFQGRTTQTRRLAAAIRTERIRVMIVFGRGGVGKTALVCRLLRSVQTGTELPEVGSLDVDSVVYLSPRGGYLLDFPSLFHDLCKLLPGAAARELRQLFNAPQQTPSALMLALLRHFSRETSLSTSARSERPSVVLLDNFEDVIDPQTGEIKDVSLDEAIRTLLTAPDHTVKLIITTREEPRQLDLLQPQAQQHIPLDEGLESPFAEAVLRAFDHDGSLGLRDAPQEQLTLAKDRTRGYPRALEALAAILSADRNTRLPELLQETQALPENVVFALVGEAYARLDPLSQDVIRALAVFPQPVPPVAVDFLLQPYREEIDAAPVLSRLFNMRFVSADAGYYSLHQVDRDFTLSQLMLHTSAEDTQIVPKENSEDSPKSSSAAKNRGRQDEIGHANRARRTGPRLPELRERAAQYLRSVRTPRETWRTWEDLWPQLTEFQLRLQNDDADEAVSILQSIDFDYLIAWGHYMTTLSMYKSLEGKIRDKGMLATAYNNVGNCYSSIGKQQAAIEHYEKALRLSQEIEARGIEANVLGNLGICSLQAGRLEEAEHRFEEAITTHREIGARASEATADLYLAHCIAIRGRLAEAMDRYGEALDIARADGYQNIEAAAQESLGDCHLTRGTMGQCHGL